MSLHDVVQALKQFEEDSKWLMSFADTVLADIGQILRANPFAVRRVRELEQYDIVLTPTVPTAAVHYDEPIIEGNPSFIRSLSEKVAADAGVPIGQAAVVATEFVLLHELYHIVYNVKYFIDVAVKALRQNPEFAGESDEVLKCVAQMITNLVHDSLINQFALADLIAMYVT